MWTADAETRSLIASQHLKLVEHWTDPWPAPVVETIKINADTNAIIVRDDLLSHGTKVRGLDYLVGHDPENKDVEEWVFGSCPATGYAQISLPAVTKKYGKKTVLFMAKRDPSKWHEYQRRGIAAGAIYNWVNMGMLTVTQARAREYAAADPVRRRVLPLGLEHPTVMASFVKVARSLNVSPDIVVTVASSGTLNRSMQLAWPSAQVFAVSVGHTMSDRDKGCATVLRSPYKFDQPVKPIDAPPFPSAPTYDAKAWPFIKQIANEQPGRTILFWNVGA